jgi:DNA-binding IclR family transcriptional regulator
MRRLFIAAALLFLAALPTAAQASHADQAVLSADPTFQGRVQESLVSSCISIANEGVAVANHKRRSDFCAAVLAAPASYKTLFAISVATDASVISDATVAGTIVLTAGNIAAQELLSTDAHIDAAISAEFNAFLILP